MDRCISSLTMMETAGNSLKIAKGLGNLPLVMIPLSALLLLNLDVYFKKKSVHPDLLSSSSLYQTFLINHGYSGSPLPPFGQAHAGDSVAKFLGTKFDSLNPKDCFGVWHQPFLRSCHERMLWVNTGFQAIDVYQAIFPLNVAIFPLMILM